MIPNLRRRPERLRAEFDPYISPATHRAESQVHNRPAIPHVPDCWAGSTAAKKHISRAASHALDTDDHRLGHAASARHVHAVLDRAGRVQNRRAADPDPKTASEKRTGARGVARMPDSPRLKVERRLQRPLRPPPRPAKQRSRRGRILLGPAPGPVRRPLAAQTPRHLAAPSFRLFLLLELLRDRNLR